MLLEMLLERSLFARVGDRARSRWFGMGMVYSGIAERAWSELYNKKGVEPSCRVVDGSASTGGTGDAGERKEKS